MNVSMLLEMVAEGADERVALGSQDGVSQPETFCRNPAGSPVYFCRKASSR